MEVYAPGLGTNKTPPPNCTMGRSSSGENLTLPYRSELGDWTTKSKHCGRGRTKYTTQLRLLVSERNVTQMEHDIRFTRGLLLLTNPSPEKLPMGLLVIFAIGSAVEQ